jgi:hypothetical protein
MLCINFGHSTFLYCWLQVYHFASGLLYCQLFNLSYFKFVALIITKIIYQKMHCISLLTFFSILCEKIRHANYYIVVIITLILGHTKDKIKKNIGLLYPDQQFLK